MASMMNSSNRLRKALSVGNGQSFGAWQMLPGTHLSRAIARSGFDWVCLDMEHGNISDNEIHESIHAISSTCVSPLVRIPANEEWMIKRALDAGAHGIVVPLVYNVSDAKQVVAASKFPPRGRRGFGSPFSPGAFDSQGRLSGFDYMNAANDNLVTIVQIETQEALEQVEEIAKVDGIDVLFIGPFDLGNNIGCPVQGEFAPELKKAINRILHAAQDAGKISGIYCTSGESAKIYAEKGFQMISVVNDMRAVSNFMAQSLATAKIKNQ